MPSGVLTSYSLGAARSNPAFLAEYALRLTPKSFHLKWQRAIDENERTVIFAPPEYGKSSQILLARPLDDLGKNPNLRIGLISETATLSRKWLGRIKENILWNGRLHEVYPDLRPAMGSGNRPAAWYSNAILVERELEFSLTDPHYSVEAIGVGGTIMGSRFDRLYFDDIITNRNAFTEAGRDKTYDWIKRVAITRLSNHGKIGAINNTWHEEDAFHRLPEENPELWHVERLVASDPEASYPEVYPPDRLAALMAELGLVEYGRQFLQVALGSATNLLPAESIRDCQRLCNDPAGWWHGEYDQGYFEWITAGLDLGASERPGSHLSAIAVEGLAKEDGLKHLLHMRSGQWVGKPIIREVIQVQRELKPHEWLVETNQAQMHVASMLSDKTIIFAVAKELGIPEGEAEKLADDIRIFGQYTTTTHKRGEAYWAIRGMGADFDARRWRLPKDQPEVEYLIREARRYSLQEHTGDRLIALWLANLRLEGIGTAMLIDAFSV
jgi:hypothetical protein